MPDKHEVGGSSPLEPTTLPNGSENKGNNERENEESIEWLKSTLSTLSPPRTFASQSSAVWNKLHTLNEVRFKDIMFIENRIRNEQIIEKNINEKSDGFSVVG